MKSRSGLLKSIKSLTKTRYFRTTAAITAATVIAISLLLNLFTYGISFVRYYGSGMEPALEGGQVLLVQRTSRVSQGDIIAFYYNNKVLVRRVICTGGGQVSIDKSGTVSVNGEELPEPYITEKSIGQCSISFPFSVPSDNVFVMGDNRAVSMDSRLQEIGAISSDRIIGKVVLSVIPLKGV